MHGLCILGINPGQKEKKNCKIYNEKKDTIIKRNSSTNIFETMQINREPCMWKIEAEK
jgi:hypothetical protein